jgi:antitoxin MazE
VTKQDTAASSVRPILLRAEQYLGPNPQSPNPQSFDPKLPSRLHAEAFFPQVGQEALYVGGLDLCDTAPATRVDEPLKLMAQMWLDLVDIAVYTVCIRQMKGISMNKKLIKHGNSLALVIDKPILEVLQISADTPLELTTNGDSLLVSPVRDKRRQKKLRASLDKINRKFGDDLKRLAE